MKPNKLTAEVLIDHEDCDALYIYLDPAACRAHVVRILQEALDSTDETEREDKEEREVAEAQKRLIAAELLPGGDLDKAWHIYRMGLEEHDDHPSYVRGEDGWSWEEHVVDLPPAAAQPSMRYCLPTGSTLDSLEDEVNRRCADGWIPHGNITAVGPLLAQPMTRTL